MTLVVNADAVGSRHTTICMTTLSQAGHAVIVTPDPWIQAEQDHAAARSDDDGGAPHNEAETSIADAMLAHQSHDEIHSFFHGPPTEVERAATLRSAQQRHNRRPIRKMSSLSTVAEVASQRSFSLLEQMPSGTTPPAVRPMRPAMDLEAIRALARAALESPIASRDAVIGGFFLPGAGRPADRTSTENRPTATPDALDNMYPAGLEVAFSTPAESPIQSSPSPPPSPDPIASESSHQSTSRLVLRTPSWVPRQAPPPPPGYVGEKPCDQPENSRSKAPAKLRKSKPPVDSQSRPSFPRTPPETTWSADVRIQGEGSGTRCDGRAAEGVKKSRRPLFSIWQKRKGPESGDWEMVESMLSRPGGVEPIAIDSTARQSRKGTVLRKEVRATTNRISDPEPSEQAKAPPPDVLVGGEPQAEEQRRADDRPSLLRRLSSKVRSRRTLSPSPEAISESQRVPLDGQGLQLVAETGAADPYATLAPLNTAPGDLPLNAMASPDSGLSRHRRSKSVPGTRRRNNSHDLAAALPFEANRVVGPWVTAARHVGVSSVTVKVSQVSPTSLRARSDSLSATASKPGQAAVAASPVKQSLGFGKRDDESGIAIFTARHSSIKTDLNGHSLPKLKMTSEGSDNLDRRRSRKLLLQIEDDVIFATVVEKLLQDDEPALPGLLSPVMSRPLSGLERTDLRLRPCPAAANVSASNIVRAYFIVREFVLGERRFVKHMLQGIQRIKWQVQAAPLVPPIPSRSSSLQGPIVRPASLFIAQSTVDVRIPVRASSYPLHNASTSYLWNLPVASRQRQPSRRPLSVYDEPISPAGSEASAFSNAVAASFAYLRPTSTASQEIDLDQRMLWVASLSRVYQVNSEMLRQFESDPSPANLAKTFVSMRQTLEETFGSWAEVAGAVSLSGLGREAAPKRDHGMSESRKRRQSLGSKSHKRESSGDRLHLGDLLIMPVQRVAQYPLLFRQLYNHVETGTQASVWLYEALDAATEIIEECNSRQASLPPRRAL